MLEKLTLENYRGYSYHEIYFRDLTIVVGKNNAGKSTLIEALRLLSIITNKYETAPYKSVPDWLEIGRRDTGISPSLRGIDFSYENISYSYNEPPAIITAEFTNKAKIIIYFAGEKKLHAVLYKANGEVCGKDKLSELKLPTISILPQIAPLLTDEKVLNEEYVRSNVDSTTSSRHFRNQLQYLKSNYQKFQDLVESTWDGLKIQEYIPGNKLRETNPYLLVREGSFATEIGNMGHGLQMWVQTMWFLARCSRNTTIVLDEPDVYMHADLQRKLIRLLKSDFKQVVVATHSIEIMSEVGPESVLVIDRSKSKSIFASDFTAVQKVLLNIGSIHNIALARLWSAKKFLIVEGKDIDILKRIQNTLFKFSKEPLDAIPQMSIGGWGGWNRAIGSKIMLKNAGDETIMTYCILDRDYQTGEEINERHAEAKKHDINLKIWERKEIENYLIVPSAIKRIIERDGSTKVKIEKIAEKIDELVEEMKEEYLESLMDKIHIANRRNNKYLEPSSAKKIAETQLKKDWENKLAIVSGKSILKKLCNWTNETFNVSFNSNKLAQELSLEEIPNELREVMTKIENKQKI